MTITSGEMLLPSETDFSRFCLTLRRSASCSGGSSSLARALLETRDLGLDVGLLGERRVEAGAREALDEEADAPVGELQHPHDRGDRADRVEVLGARRVVLRVLLGDQHDDPLLGEGRVHRVDRLLAGHRERQDDEREDDDVLQRQDGEDVRDRKVGFPFGGRDLFFFELGHGRYSSCSERHRDLDLLFAQVRHARENDLENAVLHAGLRMMRVDGTRERHRLHEAPEVALHAEETHSFPRPDAALLGAADQQDPAADRHLDVARPRRPAARRGSRIVSPSSRTSTLGSQDAVPAGVPTELFVSTNAAKSRLSSPCSRESSTIGP